MLQVNFIRENFEQAVEGLNKRNFPEAEQTLSQILELDRRRKETQTERDQLQAEANSIAKEIGGLMKAGRREEAEQIKGRTADIKSQIKTLEGDIDNWGKELKTCFYTFPNIPNEKFPQATSAKDTKFFWDKAASPQWT